MITPDEIKKKALRKYPEYLSSLVSGSLVSGSLFSGSLFFPLMLPSNKKISTDFKQLHTELAQLIDHSKDKKGYGYTVSYHQVKSRKHGVQQLPSSIFFDTEQDYLKFIGKKKEAEQFKEDLQLIQKRFPQLDQWLKKHFKKLLMYQGTWPDIIKVCLYFLSTPALPFTSVNCLLRFIQNSLKSIKQFSDNCLIYSYLSTLIQKKTFSRNALI